jgi:hypothetical protein
MGGRIGGTFDRMMYKLSQELNAKQAKHKTEVNHDAYFLRQTDKYWNPADVAVNDIA